MSGFLYWSIRKCLQYSRSSKYLSILNQYAKNQSNCCRYDTGEILWFIIIPSFVIHSNGYRWLSENGPILAKLHCRYLEIISERPWTFFSSWDRSNVELECISDLPSEKQWRNLLDWKICFNYLEVLYFKL